MIDVMADLSTEEALIATTAVALTLIIISVELGLLSVLAAVV
jgi:hypothetical protein